jgi:fructokinase
MRIGIDLGGTKIEAAVLGADGRELGRHRVPTPRDDYDGTIAAIVDLVKQLEEHAGQTGTVGVGTPGAISRDTGRMKNANSGWLNDRPLDEDLSRALARPIRMANDANCFALSEATDGAGSDAAVVFGAILGTGVGGGIVIDGRIVSGCNGIGGEWGHNPLPWPSPQELPGPTCYCGRNGCIETFCSGPGLEQDFARATGRTETSHDIVRLAAKGDGEAAAALTRYEDRLARGLASVINVTDPDVVVLGGGMSNIDRLYDNVTQIWGQYVFSDRIATRLVKARHGDSSGVRGAARLWD